MIIVVEGPDNAGKTTLALELAKKLRALFVKAERPRHRPDLLIYQGILEQAQRYSGLVVVDRHLAISEPIYGSIIRGGHDLDADDIALCCSRMDAVIYCRPPTGVILASLSGRTHMSGVLENAGAIIRAYDALFHPESAWDNLFHYDFTKQNPQDVISWMAAFSTAAREAP